MAAVVVQQSPALTPTGAPPSSSPFVPAPDSSPYSRPHPPTVGESRFPGSYPSETQLKEPKDAIDHLADAAPQSGGSILPVPGTVMKGVQSVLTAMNETAKAYLPTSIGNALPVGSTDPNVIEAETQNPTSYAVPSDLPTASSSVPIETVAETTSIPVVEELNRADSFDTDTDVRASGAQIGNMTGLASGTAAAGFSSALDREASTRSLAPSSVQDTGTTTTTTTTGVTPFAPDVSQTHYTPPSTLAPTPLTQDSNILLPESTSELKHTAKTDSKSTASVTENKRIDPVRGNDDAASSTISNLGSSSVVALSGDSAPSRGSKPTLPLEGNDDVASSTISNLGSSSVGALSSDSVRSGESGTVSDGDETGEGEGDGDESNEKGEKKNKAKRFVQKMKGKLHMGH